MGTRSSVIFLENGDPLVNIYRQYDGYLAGRGLELAEFLNNIKIINGISSEVAGTSANGAGCLAAQWIAKEKTSIGEVYIFPLECVESWVYRVNIISKDIYISVSYEDNIIREDMSPREFLDLCSSQPEDVPVSISITKKNKT